MSPLQFYVANILSALVWAPAHVFPGVLLATALRLAGVSAEQLTILIIAVLIVVLAVVWALRLAFARQQCLSVGPENVRFEKCLLKCIRNSDQTQCDMPHFRFE